MSIQKKLDELNPFVTTIRYSERPIVEIAFPPSWGLPESNNIEVTLLESSDTDISRYMVYGCEGSKVNVDELLEYMRVSIKLNKEREAKKTMLNEKIIELTTLFDKTPLAKLKKLRFNLEDVATPTISLGEIEPPVVEQAPTGDTISVSSETTHPFGWSEEEVAENDKQQREEKELWNSDADMIQIDGQLEVDDQVRTFTTENGQKVDLPPKKKKEPVLVDAHDAPACRCEVGEMCPECMDI